METEPDNTDVIKDPRVIEKGETVVLQKYNYMRTHVLNPKKNLQLGRDIVNLAGVIGEKYGTTFEMVPSPTNKKQFELKVAQEVVDFEDLFLTGEGGQDNRDIVDSTGTQSSQNLSKAQIEEMIETGVSGKNIVEKLIENSDTFQNKTKFSQAKYMKKKAKKYHQYVMIRKPTIRLLMDILYKMDPIKIMNLRIDSLSQILNMVNVQSGGRYMVYETGAQGLVVAAMLERIGDVGELVHVYQTGQPQSNALNSMGLQNSQNIKTLNIQHLRSLEQGKDILEYQNKDQDPELSEKDSSEEPSAKKVKLENGDSAENGTTKPAARMSLRERSVEAFNSAKSKKLDGLVIVCKQHPGNIVLYLSKYIAPSRPFAIYSAYKEPLMDAYVQLKDAGVAIMVNLSETWLRNHQVLPQRTHPTVLMSGGGGYLLTGTFISNSS